MAITYNLEVEEVGVGVTTHSGISATNFSLSGLNAESDYRVRVQQYDDVAFTASLFSAWADFTTLAQLTDIIAQLGPISNSQAVNPVTTSIFVPDVIVETWDIELTETGQSPVLITGITTTSYALTGLTENSEYTIRARHVSDINGGVYTSLWSGSATFTAVAAAPDPVVALLGTINGSQTVNPVTTSVDALPPVVAVLGPISNTQTINPVTTSVDDPLSPVTAQLGSISNSQTLNPVSTVTPVIAQLSSINNAQTVNPVSTSIATPGEVVAPTHYAVEVIKLSDMSIVASGVVQNTSFAITGLSANVVGGNDYRVSVVGVSDLGAKSQAATVDFSTVMQTLTASNTASRSPEQAIDQFYISANSLYDEIDNIAMVFGEVNQAFDTITGTFDSAPLTINVNGLQYTSEELATDPISLPAPEVYPADVEVAPTDWTGASTAASTDSATLTLSDVSTTEYKQNNSGKPSFWHSSGTLATSHNHVWNNGEIIIPDNGKLCDAVGRIRAKHDFTLTLVKNGDYGNPVATVAAVTVDESGNTRYQCDMSLSDIVCVGGDRFELSINPLVVSSTEVAWDPSLGFFTLTVTEVYV